MKKVRYAVVGAGRISQEAFLPSVDQTGNSTIAAIVSGNQLKARKLAEFYGVEHVFGYEQYGELLSSGLADAIYLALPNSMHADYAIRAARAGLHILVEKPMATTTEDCVAMVAAADRAGVMLMTAYRLHNEPGTIEVIESIRRGDIGDPRIFSSVLSFQADASNHRLKSVHWGGPLQDIGVYCVNTSRHVFGCEPCEARAMVCRAADDLRFAEVEETIGATLRFPGGRLANFVVSFGAESIGSYRVVGTEGELEMSPGYKLDGGMHLRLRRGGRVTERSFPQVDPFSGQLSYFSDCIIQGVSPGATSREGWADVWILLAIEAAARTGQLQRIDLPPMISRLSSSMVREYPPTERRLALHS